MRYIFSCPVVVAGLVVMTGSAAVPALALDEEQMSVPPFSLQGPVDAGGLSAAGAVADCQLAQATIENEKYFQGLVIFDACIDELRDVELQSHYLHFRGTLFERIGAHNRAIDDFSRAVKQQPENTGYAVSLGRAWLGREDNKLALALFRSTLRLAPHNADVLAGLGTAWLQSGETQRAIAFLQRALEINPGHVPALRDRGLASLYKGAAAPALADFDRAIALAAPSSDLFLYRGMAQHRLGQSAAALEDFNRAADLDPTSPRVLVNRGALLAHLDRPEEAAADFTAAIDLNPGTADAYYGRGLLGARLAGTDENLLDQARSDLKQAITLDPDNPQLDAAMVILQPVETKPVKRRY